MEYQLLPVNDDPPVLDDRATIRARTRSNILAWAAISISILCMAVNLLLIRMPLPRPYTFPSSTSFLTTQGMTRKDIDMLRRPSQFIGLDKIHRNATPPENMKSFVNFPILMAQVDSSRPYEVVTKTRQGIRTSIGTVYPELSDMIVSPSISTIVQFRALDYGMEKCELQIIMPATDKDNGYPLTIPSTPLQIYSIVQRKRLYADTLSYSTRPHRGKLVGEPYLAVRNSSWSHTFACLMDEIYTFEVASSCGISDAGNCAIIWTQDKEHESFPAMLMTQYSTA